MNNSEQRRRQCGACGRPARVRVLKGYIGRDAVVEWLCLDCAACPGAAADEPREARSMRRALPLVGAGLMLVLASALADRVGLRGSETFGWYQISGVAAGGMLTLVGLLWRADLLAAAGFVVLALAGAADLLALGGQDGFGWKQSLAAGAGLVLVLAGCVVHWTDDESHVAPERSSREHRRPAHADDGADAACNA